jgi:2-phosphoglycerate kinase
MAHAEQSPPWTVLVLFGASGVGKSTAAAAVTRRHGATWMQVDDLRLALQYSNATLPEHNDELYYFIRAPDFAFQPPDEVLGGFIGTARAMVPAVRVVIGNHVATNDPMVIEGDGIMPSLISEPEIAPMVQQGIVRLCGVRAGSVDDLLESMLARGRGMHHVDPVRARRHAEVNTAFDRWLAAEAERFTVPTVASRPFASLAERIESAIRRPGDPEEQ